MTDNEAKSVTLYEREEEYEYYKWGDLVLVGMTGADGMIKQIKPDEVLPVGTALYVRRGEK